MSENIEKKERAAQVVRSVPKIWTRMKAVVNVDESLRTDRYAISYPNMLHSGVVPVNFHIRIHNKEADTERFISGLLADPKTAENQEARSREAATRLHPVIYNALAGHHTNPDGTIIPMMRMNQKTGSLEPVSMETYAPSFKKSFKQGMRPLELTIPFYKLSAILDAPGHITHYRSGKYVSFLQSALVKKGKPFVIVGLLPMHDEKREGAFLTGGVAVLLDYKFVLALRGIHREVQKLLQKGFQPGEILYEMYGLFQERGAGQVGLPTKQIGTPVLPAPKAKKAKAVEAPPEEPQPVTEAAAPPAVEEIDQDEEEPGEEVSDVEDVESTNPPQAEA